MSQALIGALRTVFGADTAAFEAGVTRIDRESSKAERRLKKFSKKAKSIGKDLSLNLTAPIAAIGAISFKTASDVAELESAFDVTFKNTSSQMRKWAVETGDTLQRSTQEIQDSAVAFASLFNKALDPSQANELTKTFTVLTQDLASFKNLSNEVAQQKLFSGLTGEAEPLKSVGVFINEAAVKSKLLELGLQKVNGAYTDQQKIVARAALIQEQLADAQGDVIRTSDSTANQIKAAQAAFSELQVEIGTKLLPVFTPLIAKLTSALEWFGNLDDGMQNTILVAAGVAAVIGPVVTAFGSVISITAPLIAGLYATATAAGVTGASITAMLGPLGLILAAVAAATLAYKKWGGEANAARRAHKDLYDLIEQSKSIRDQEVADTKEATQAKLKEALAIREAIKARLAEKKARLEREEKNFLSATRSVQGAGAGYDPARGPMRRIQTLNTAIKDATDELAQTDKSIAELESRIEGFGKKPAGGGSGGGSGGGGTGGGGTTVKEKESVIDAVRREIEANGRLAAALQTSQREYDVTQATMRLMADGFKGSTEEARKLAEQLVDSENQIKAVQETIAEGERQKAEQEAEKQRIEAEKLEAQRRVQERHAATIESIKQEIEVNRQLNAALQISQKEYRITAEVLRLMESGFAGSADEARKLAEELIASQDALAETEKAAKDTGDEMSKSFEGALDSFETLVDGIKNGDFESILKGIGGILDQVFGQGKGGSGGLGDIFGTIGGIFGGFRAKGGPVRGNKSYIVGENGPEWFTPGLSGNITANKDMGGKSVRQGDINATFVMPPGTDMREFKRSEGQIGALLARATQRGGRNQ